MCCSCLRQKKNPVPNENKDVKPIKRSANAKQSAQDVQSDEDEDELEAAHETNQNENVLEKSSSLWLRGANRIHNQVIFNEFF